jgi:phage tail sheath gpL-like
MAYGADTIIDTRVPGIRLGYDTTNALTGAQVSEKVVCFVGELGKDADEYAQTNKLYNIASVAQAEKLFGKDSNLCKQIKSAFSVFFGQFKAIGLEEVMDEEDETIGFDFEAVFDVLKGYKADIISFPYPVNKKSTTVTDDKTDSGLMLKKYIERVSGPKEQRPAIAVGAFVGNMLDSNNEELLPGEENSLGANNPRIVLVNAKDCAQSEAEICGAVCAMILSKPDPALPFRNFALPLTGYTDYLEDEKNWLLHHGVSPLSLRADGTLTTVRIISTETDGTSEKVPDLWIRSLDYVREWVRTEVDRCFLDEKITDSSVSKVRSVIFGSLKKLEVQQIAKNVDLYKDNLIVEPNPNNVGFLTCKIPFDAVVGLQGMSGNIELILS